MIINELQIIIYIQKSQDTNVNNITYIIQCFRVIDRVVIGMMPSCFVWENGLITIEECSIPFCEGDMMLKWMM